MSIMNPDRTISSYELFSIFLDEKHRQLAVKTAASRPEWTYFYKVFNERTAAIRDRTSQFDMSNPDQIEKYWNLIDEVVPDELARAILEESGIQCYYLESRGEVTTVRVSEKQTLVSVVDLYSQFGGRFLEMLFDRCANNVNTPHYSKGRTKRDAERRIKGVRAL